eukprot:17761-Heterococcus_DN1.PRE.5
MGPQHSALQQVKSMCSDSMVQCAALFLLSFVHCIADLQQALSTINRCESSHSVTSAAVREQRPSDAGPACYDAASCLLTHRARQPQNAL